MNLQPDGITIVKGQSLLTTKVDNNSDSKQENATAILVDLNGVRSDDPRSSTGVVFFKTNSTGQLAFLDDMIAIYQGFTGRYRNQNVGMERCGYSI